MSHAPGVALVTASFSSIRRKRSSVRRIQPDHAVVDASLGVFLSERAPKSSPCEKQKRKKQAGPSHSLESKQCRMKMNEYRHSVKPSPSIASRLLTGQRRKFQCLLRGHALMGETRLWGEGCDAAHETSSAQIRKEDDLPKPRTYHHRDTLGTSGSNQTLLSCVCQGQSIDMVSPPWTISILPGC